jgi:hypothetical protein
MRWRDIEHTRKGLENVYKITIGKSERKRPVGRRRRKSEGNVELDGEILVCGGTRGIIFPFRPPKIRTYFF